MRHLLPPLFAVLIACVAPRDAVDVAAKECTSSSQCPADGKHYCDRASGKCMACSGPCPWANAPVSDSGSTTAVSDAGATGTATGDTAGADTANADAASADTATDTNVVGVDANLPADIASADMCAVRGCADYDGDKPCQCDESCVEPANNDCCPDYATVCAADGG